MLVRGREHTSGIAGAFGGGERRGVDDRTGGGAVTRSRMSTFSVLIGSCVRGAGSSVVGDSRSAVPVIDLARS